MIGKEQFTRLVWDYDISPEEFERVLEGREERGWFNKEWATVRVLENLNYYQAKDLVDFGFLQQNWPQIKPRIFSKAIQEGYEYLLQRRALSPAR